MVIKKRLLATVGWRSTSKATASSATSDSSSADNSGATCPCYTGSNSITATTGTVTSGAYTEEIETEVVGGMATHVSSYGMVIVRLGNFEIAIDEEDAKNLKRLYTDAAYLRTVGGVGAFMEGFLPE